ncbi:class I SAM-dependent methyltransferase [Flavobacterium sp. UBA6135]|uniref:class I SAM-dependent methyltransferase n=1 Tax=Flavobacterium sp. UBA6135 TaxID=1946553 RepID=UPI0025C1EC66|nr:class I SAM-dependent methyltransferase [Flavobacterium sp. UBA6135]
MYNIIKKNVYKLIPKRVLIQNEQLIRKMISFFYKGNTNLCTICNSKLKHFIEQKEKGKLCPNCGSLPRNRRLWTLLNNEYLQKDMLIIDFSPSRCLYRKLKKIKTINYIASDLSDDFIAEYNYDITNINAKENQFDLIICYHILEHVIEDSKAIKELRRVLKQDGKILIQTPFKEGNIYENFAITKPEERLKHFGQEDHVRIYSIEGLKSRLEQESLKVEIRDYKNYDDYLGLVPEVILVVSKN